MNRVLEQVAPQAAGFDPARLAAIARWMEGYVAAGKYPGASLLIARGGAEAFFHACGMRDVEAGLPFARDTVVRIYSMTKPIVSTMLMMLVERGELHLAAPVSDFLPEFAAPRALVPGAVRLDQAEPCAPPTLHQLLTHTSGLSYSFNPGLVPAAMAEEKLDFPPRGSGNLAEVTARLARLPLAFPPGSRWEYSVGIDVIGRVIEVVTGKPLDAVLRDEIFAPLGMEETGFAVPAHARDRFAALYSSLDDPMALNAARDRADKGMRRVDSPDRSPFLAPECFSGGGGLTGTIDDYMRFVEMIRRGGALGDARLLSPPSVAFMRRNHLRGDIASMGPSSFAEQPMEGVGFGIGGSVVLEPALSGTPGSVGDWSWGGMASTFFWTDPVHDLSVVFFTQLTPSSSYPARPQLKALVHAALTDPGAMG